MPGHGMRTLEAANSPPQAVFLPCAPPAPGFTVENSMTRNLPQKPATALIATAIGAAALGALAVGAMAVGTMAIGKLAVEARRIKRLEIDQLVIHRLTRPDA